KLLFEYRSFAQSFGKTELIMREFAASISPTESYDYYILSECNETYNILIRNGKLIIKELISKGAGLEKWNVNYSEQFPLSKDFIEEAFFPAIGLQSPALERNMYQTIDFIEEIVNTDPDIKMVEVYKKKYEFIYKNCNCELAENLINSAFIKTLNIESEAIENVNAVIQEFGIEKAFPNVNYVTKIKQIIGLIRLNEYKLLPIKP
ncbi:MAG TPA: hypothetical protein DCQ31_00315, partial [Bacteroidales bacterium]|nr:hypothetical protein [Bacteroidales bacterium]